MRSLIDSKTKQKQHTGITKKTGRNYGLNHLKQNLKHQKINLKIYFFSLIRPIRASERKSKSRNNRGMDQSLAKTSKNMS